MSISGKRITLKVGGVTVSGTYRHTARGKVDELDRTTGADNGFANFDGGVREMRISATLYVDLTDGFGLGVDGIKEGNVLTDVVLYRDGTGSASTTLPSALVLSGDDGVEVRGKCEYSIEMVAKGEYTRQFPG